MSGSITSLSSLTDWLTAIGTILAVVVALFIAFLSSLLEYLRRPILKTEFENKEPFCRHTSIPNQYGYAVNAYLLRVRVKNIGRSMARDCEGRLLRVVNSAKQERTDFDPSNLHWAGTKQEKTINIHKKSCEYLDIVFAREDQPRISLGVNEEGLTEASSSFSRHEDIILDVAIFGRNTEPIERFFQVCIENPNELWSLDWDKIGLMETKL